MSLCALLLWSLEGLESPGQPGDNVTASSPSSVPVVIELKVREPNGGKPELPSGFCAPALLLTGLGCPSALSVGGAPPLMFLQGLNG